MPTISLSIGKVHYSEQGQGEPIILLHANPGDSRDYEAVIPTLAQTHRVLALDWPGYGESEMPPQPERTDVLFYTQALREFLVALALPAVFIIGNSVGGNVAARLASESPELVRGLVLVAPGGFTAHNFISRAFCRLQGSRFSLSPRRWAGLYLKRKTPTTQAMMARASTVQADPQCLALNRALWRSFVRPESDLREIAKKIQAPTLLIFGKQDPAISARLDGKVAARTIAHAAFVVLPSGHAPFAEVPDLFLAKVQPFFQQCETIPASLTSSASA